MVTSQQKDEEWSSLSSSQKVLYVLKNITVEPVAFLFVFSSAFKRIVTQNLNLEKACGVNLGYSEEVCSALRARQVMNYTHEEEEVQKLVASMKVYSSILQSFFPTVLILFAGSWSDRTKRRIPFMLFPLIGETLSILGLLICVYFFLEIPLEVAVFVDSFFPYVTGGDIVFFMSVYSYISDISSLEMRTVRVGFLNMFTYAGMPLGRGLSGITLNAMGFSTVYLGSALMNLCAILYLCIKVKEKTSLSKHATNINEKCALTHDKNIENPRKCCFSLLRKLKRAFYFSKDFFDFKRIRDTVFVVFRTDGTKNRKKKIILLILAHTIYYGSFSGEDSMEYLYMRFRFNWNEIDYSFYTTFYAVLHIIGNCLCVVVLSHILGFDDAILGMISSTSKMLSYCLMAFAETEWQMFLAPVVCMIDASNIATRSIGSKLVSKEELGKLYSVYDFFAAFAPLIYGPMFSIIYTHTLNTFPGTFLLSGASLLFPVVAIFGWLYLQENDESDAITKELRNEPDIKKDYDTCT